MVRTGGRGRRKVLEQGEKEASPQIGCVLGWLGTHGGSNSDLGLRFPPTIANVFTCSFDG